jgi:hypothetical protein
MRALLAVGGAVALVALVPLGRWEHDRASDEQSAGLERAWASVGGRIDAPALSAYRITVFANCLLYERDGNPYALELCFDARGRLVEAIERGEETRISSVRHDAARASVRVDTGSLFRLLVRAGGIPPDTPFRGLLPLARDLSLAGAPDPGDTGPRLIERP